MIFSPCENITLPTVGDFVEVGSAYSFEVGPAGAGGVPATLTIIPPPDRRSTITTTLVVADREVPQSESLGSAEADSSAGTIGDLTAGSRAAASAPSLVRQGSFKIKS